VKMVKTRSCDVTQDLEAAMPVRHSSVKEEILEVVSFCLYAFFVLIEYLIF
jgi:hypothetical protein